MVTFALIGCAHIHTPGFIKTLAKRQQAGEIKVKYIWDPTPARAQAAAAELGAKFIATHGRVWSDDEVKAVVICSETNLHKKLVTTAAAAGKHMFVEKPLGMGSKDSRAMANAIDQAGVLFTTGYFNRGNPMHRFIKKEIDAGSFGKITRVRGSNVHSGALGGWFDAKPADPAHDWRWMADPGISGCGAFGDLGTHLLDLLMWYCGDVVQATAQIDHGTRRYENCDETGEGLLRFKNGVIGTLAGAWDDLANPCPLLVSGTEGHAAVVHGQLHFQSKRVEGSDAKLPVSADNLPPALPHAFDQFINAVTGNGPHELVKPQEAAARVCVMEAMYQGDAKGKWITPK